MQNVTMLTVIAPYNSILMTRTIDIYLGRLLKGPASLPCFVLLVLLVAAAKILAAKVGRSIDQPT
jgi:hypothetical protein